MEFLHLVPLLRLSWLAAIIPIIAASLPFKPLLLIRRSLSHFAARGKTANPKSPLTLPQRFFLHFYVVAVSVTTCLVICTWLYAYNEMLTLSAEPLGISSVAGNLAGGSRIYGGHGEGVASAEEKLRSWRTVFVLLLMEAQVLRRLYETRVVFNYSPSARMHVVGYLTGLLFYIAAPLSLASGCAQGTMSYAGGQLAKFIVKGRERMQVIVFSWWDLLKPLISLGWCQWIGSVIFIWGWMHQLHCHAILGSLRKYKGADEYAIPRGDWFEYVSCPHYLAEILDNTQQLMSMSSTILNFEAGGHLGAWMLGCIFDRQYALFQTTSFFQTTTLLIIYAGILVASGGSDITVWLLFFFVVANLVFAAAETHKWYGHKFESYPRSRRAILPFIY